MGFEHQHIGTPEKYLPSAYQFKVIFLSTNYLMSMWLPNVIFDYLLISSAFFHWTFSGFLVTCLIEVHCLVPPPLDLSKCSQNLHTFIYNCWSVRWSASNSILCLLFTICSTIFFFTAGSQRFSDHTRMQLSSFIYTSLTVVCFLLNNITYICRKNILILRISFLKTQIEIRDATSHSLLTK